VPPNINSNTFNRVSKFTPLYVPCGKETVYAAATGWIDFHSYSPQNCLNYISVTTLSNDVSLGVAVGGDRIFGRGTLTLYAISLVNSIFTGWSDGNTDNPRTVLVSSDSTFTANFTADSSAVFKGQITDLENDTASLNDTITNYKLRITKQH
jgi:hypothetical protein